MEGNGILVFLARNDRPLLDGLGSVGWTEKDKGEGRERREREWLRKVRERERKSYRNRGKERLIGRYRDREEERKRDMRKIIGDVERQEGKREGRIANGRETDRLRMRRTENIGKEIRERKGQRRKGRNRGILEKEEEKGRPRKKRKRGIKEGGDRAGLRK
eukprot:1343610-Amorphochlora_amoeboformis.AAC.1